tara:strand:+ start:2428 stop:3408 length:981 start_codon:yes stop_codon:yes gene_type:complete
MGANFEQMQNYVNQRKALRQQKFDADFWESKIRNIMSNSGDFNVKDKTISSPMINIENPTDSWASYVKATSSRGLKPNYEQFLQQYNNLSNVRSSAILNNLQSAQASGMTMKEIKKAIKNNPEIQQMLTEGIKSTADTDAKTLMGSYLPTRKKTFGEKLKTPLLAGGAAAAALGGPMAYRYGMDKIQDLRGDDILRDAKDLTDKKISAADKTKMQKARYAEYKKGWKGKKIKSAKGKVVTSKAADFKTWSARKTNVIPDNWSSKTLSEAESVFGKSKVKDLGLYKTKPSIGKALLKTGGKALKAGGIRAALGLGAMQLLSSLTSEE